MEETSLPTLRYIGIFALTNAITVILINILVHGFQINVSSASKGILFAAAYFAMSRFVTENKRAPNKQEKIKLIWGSIISSFLIDIIVFIIILQIIDAENGWKGVNTLIHSVSVTTILIILSIIIGMYYVVLNIIYGWGARKFAQKFIK